MEVRVFIEEIIEMSESEITPDKYESESKKLLLVGRKHALLREPGNAASAAVGSLSAAIEWEAHVRLCFA